MKHPSTLRLLRIVPKQLTICKFHKRSKYQYQNLISVNNPWSYLNPILTKLHLNFPFEQYSAECVCIDQQIQNPQGQKILITLKIITKHVILIFSNNQSKYWSDHFVNDVFTKLHLPLALTLLKCAYNLASQAESKGIKIKLCFFKENVCCMWHLLLKKQLRNPYTTRVITHLDSTFSRFWFKAGCWVDTCSAKHRFF